jgi:pimeloyl-ACP methyl ester carboxylesterase
MKVVKGLDDAARIRPEERDYHLSLETEDWGQDLRADRWAPDTHPDLHYRRIIPIHDGIAEPGATAVEEVIIPFPSAPIYGVNRKAEYGQPLEQRPNMHSVRVLRRPNGAPIHRLFILHNGLNEVDDLKFYYRLADWIMRQQEVNPAEGGAACLVMPFPGHLMHSPFPGPFSETPLSRYLSDAGDLFRQFLKYMVGMRWLLSIVANSDAKGWMAGGSLLNQATRIRDLTDESGVLFDMSEKRIRRTEEAAQYEKAVDSSRSPIFDIGKKTVLDQVAITDRLLRKALDRDVESSPDTLRVHVVGYSLGGFVAQSVFFAWPQVVSSCTTICSGGAISALSPTAFAQPEEWQSVLHALRPETTNSMLQGRLGDDEREEREEPVPVDTVAGMPLERYGYFQRIFEQVFLQEDRGSYKERLSEYALRMFFVSGGEDPIVPPANILDASPKEGTTMLSVAGLTHFLNQDPKDEGDRREKEQRDFWLPEAGGMIARAAIHAEQVHLEEREGATKLKGRQRRPAKREGVPRLSSDLLTNGYMFEDALDWVLESVTDDGGWLFISRNMLPAAFIRSRHFTTWGKGLHHHDLRIQRYTLGLRHRAAMLKEIRDRLTLVLPEQLERWFINLSARFDPNSDAPSGRVTTKAARTKIWEGFAEDWWPCIRQFQAGNIAHAVEPDLKPADLASVISSWIDAEQKYLKATHLPDVWIGIRADSHLMAAQSQQRDVVNRLIVEKTEAVLADVNKRPQARKKQARPTLKRLQDDLAAERIRIVQISGAEFNPRYRGSIERSPSAATKLLARLAVGLVRSGQMPDPVEERTES